VTHPRGIHSFVGPDLGSLEGLADDDVACVSREPCTILDHERALVAFEMLGAPAVLAATVGAGVVASSPYGTIAPAVMGYAGALRGASFDSLARSYVDGANIELDVGAELFLVRDGTGTDALLAGDRVMATETGTEPAVVIGGTDDLDERVTDLASREIAPDIVQTGFWTPRTCAAVVRASEAAAAWGSDDDDPVPGLEVSLATLNPRLFAQVEADLERAVLPRWRMVWAEVGWFGLHDAFVIKYVAQTDAAELRLHHDVAQVSGSVRLNDGYDGGTLEFPRQHWSNRDVPVGDLVAWPSLVTHPHRSTPVTRGTKYGLTIWTRLPG
jgi:hypothetical protein